MTGSLLQLVAKGMEDVYIIGDPQITLFVIVYRRIGNFSMYDHMCDFKGGNFSTEFKLQFERLGDLLHKLWLVVDIPDILLDITKSTFEYISSILTTYGISWNYSPESKTSLVTLHNYNGGSTIVTSNKINTNIFEEGYVPIIFKSGKLFFSDDTYVTISSGILNLNMIISDGFDLEFEPSQHILSVSMEVASGQINLTSNSMFGDVLSIVRGTVTLNKEKITTGSVISYVYYITNVNLTSEFTSSIINAINLQIQKLIESYNFFANSIVITRNSDYIINKSVNVFDNKDPNNINDTITDIASSLEGKMINGRNFFMYLIQTMLTKYAPQYKYNSPTYFFPKSNDEYLIEDVKNSSNIRIVQLYSTNFKQTVYPYGLLLGAIQNYSYDSVIYNANYNYSYQAITDSAGNVYTSKNSGITWTNKNISNTVLNGICISTNVNNQTVIDANGNIYLSDDSGDTWSSANNIANISLDKINMSSNGIVQTIIGTNSGTSTGYIYTSYDFWESHISTTKILVYPDKLVGIAMSSNGSKQTVITQSGIVYISSNSGSNWSEIITLSLNGATVVDIVMSNTGSIQSAVDSSGIIYVSTDYWTTCESININIVQNTNLNIVTSISMSSDGIRQSVTDSHGNVYLSSHSGARWSEAYNICSNSITKITIVTEDGKIQIVTDELGNIYMSKLYGTIWSAAQHISSYSLSGSTYQQVNIPDEIQIKLDDTSSTPLFGNIITRSNTDLSNIVNFKLYNSDDIRILFYITFINNIIRQKIILTDDSNIPFNPKMTTVLKSSEMSISNDNLLALDPDTITLDEVILFYHTIDSDITKYTVYSYEIGDDTNVYFDNNIGVNYAMYDKYKSIIQIDRDDYTTTDSYKVYKLYMQDVIKNDIVNNTIKSSQQVSLIAKVLKYNVDINIRYNFNQILNNISILTNASRTNNNHYILTFYRQYTQSLDSYVSTSGLSFIPIIDSSSAKLADNLKNFISTVVDIQVPDGIVITNYFNNYIQNQIKKFTTACQGLLRSVNYDAYVSVYALWARVLVVSGSSMLGAYNRGIINTNYPNIESSTFGKIALMNYIPLLVAKDIPVMMYNTFVTYGKQIMIDIGLDTEISHDNYDDFLTIIDFRDNDYFDRSGTLPNSIPTDVEETKKEIYQRIVGALFVTSRDGGATYVGDNANYFSELQFEKATGSTVLLSCCLRPDTFCYPYSTQNPDNSGSLVDSSSNPEDLKALPIEWLTQTYYHIFRDKVATFVNTAIPAISDTSSKQNKTAKKLLNGIIGNVINCFVLRNTLPSYVNYKNNNFSLLGLTIETNSTIQKYKKSREQIIVTWPIYSDAISSIWYQTQKGFIQLYNSLFNDTLISSGYYKNNLGSSMGLIFDYIKTQIIGTDNYNPYYYINGGDYPSSLPDSVLDSFVDVYKSLFSNVPLSTIEEPNQKIVSDVLNYIGELYPAVDTKSSSSNSSNSGFNFFKLNIGNPADSTSKAYKINTYIKDYSQLYAYLMSYYNSHKSVTLIKNDIDSLQFSTSINGTRQKNTYTFEKSSVLTSYLNDHISTKYISSITNESAKHNLISLNKNTASYWNPDIVVNDTYIGINPTGVYGVLDALYNSHLEGNIADTLLKISTIPVGKLPSDLIDFTQNPFTSYCLHKWYAGLSGSFSLPQTNSEFTYQDLLDVTNLLTANIYTVNGSQNVPSITSQTIFTNKNIAKLYTDSDKNVFPSIEYVAWLLFDTILSNKQINERIDFTSMIQHNIQKSTTSSFNSSLFSNTSSTITNDNGAIDTLQQLIINYFSTTMSTSLKQFLKITTFKNTANTDPVNKLSQYYDIKNNDSNVDINVYKQSPLGEYIIGVPLEIRLLNLLGNSKPKFAWVKELGHKIASKLTISVGGQSIESYTPELMHLVNNITKSHEHTRGYDIMTGNIPEMYTLSSKQRSIKTLLIPLPFWFCKNAGNSLPLINLLFTDVTLEGIIGNIKDLLYTDPDTTFRKPPKLKCRVLARYIYLDDDERERMAGSKMEYLIEKFNYNGSKTYSQNNLFSTGGNLVTKTNNTVNLTNLKASASIELRMCDPVKYFIWYIKYRDKTTEQPTDVINWCDFGYNIRNSDKIMKTIKTTLDSILLKMNGVIREEAHGESFYTNLIPYEKSMGSLNTGEYVYSFALYPLLLQPTGSANYSEISDSEFIITFTREVEQLFKDNSNLELKIELWAQTYNIFRCISGMGGLAFNKP